MRDLNVERAESSRPVVPRHTASGFLYVSTDRKSPRIWGVPLAVSLLTTLLLSYFTSLLKSSEPRGNGHHERRPSLDNIGPNTHASRRVSSCCWPRARAGTRDSEALAEWQLPQAAMTSGSSSIHRRWLSGMATVATTKRSGISATSSVDIVHERADCATLLPEMAIQCCKTCRGSYPCHLLRHLVRQ